MFGNRTFVFSLEKTILGLLAAATCYWMAHWQYQRYLFKIDYFDMLTEQAIRPVLDLNQNQAWQEQAHGRVRASGVYEPERQIMIINRSNHETPGVKLVTPLRVEGLGLVLVDRGFVEYDTATSEKLQALTEPGVVTVEGLLRPSQKAQFFIDFEKPAAAGQFKRRWLRLDTQLIAPQFNEPLQPFFIEQTNQKPGFGLFQEQAEVPASRHMNYTIQWISFGTFGLFLVMFSQFKRMAIKQPKREVAHES
ncbi:MAG: SURF1 family protein [Acidobacteria bacterium]|nr:SURF1 family protein [Acidobacteriota bacterium]MCB9397711.1 SURF1 family protein [Acidobacteriota bacterium]